LLESSDLIAFAATTDIGRARKFYAETLGLTLVEQNDFACVFDVNGTMLRVTAVAEALNAGYTVLGWRVDDITGTARDLAGNGVRFLRYEAMDQDADGVWTAPSGDRIAWFADPDGNTLSLTQFV
jgi:catechol 2,3-dioxygenase-like lactoylglutathione lyase family enzyme